MKHVFLVRRWLAPGMLLVPLLVLASGCGRSAPAELVYNPDNAKVIGEQFEFGGALGGGAVSGKFEDPDRTPKWATLRGVFRVDNPSKVAPLSRNPVPKEQDVCGTTAPNEKYEISSSGGIKNVLIFLSDTPPNDADQEQPKWTHPRYSFSKTEAASESFGKILPQQQREALFDQQKCVFLSHVFAMRTDQLLKIKNSDNTFHNTDMSPKRNPSENVGIPAFGEASYQPRKEEVEPFRVSCKAHSWMGAWVIFRDSPYFAVTDENGQFEIVDIPADVELEFRVWQENLKWVSPIAVENAPSSWSRGRFNISLGEGETRQVTVTIDGSSFNAG